MVIVLALDCGVGAVVFPFWGAGVDVLSPGRVPRCLTGKPRARRAASFAARASSMVLPAICPPGAMQHSVRWLVRLQFEQGVLGLLFVIAARAVLSAAGVWPCFSLLMSSCSSLTMRFLMSAELMDGLSSMSVIDVCSRWKWVPSAFRMRMILNLSSSILPILV
jgi:hypothetical protein